MKTNEGVNFGIYGVKDELTGRFHQPMFMENDASAQRWFKYVVNTTELWKLNAETYCLYKLGEFNDKNGVGDYPVIEMIATGTSVLEGEKNA